MSKIQADLVRLLDQHFGKDETKRAYKLLEEVDELIDVTVVVAHLQHLSGFTTNELLLRGYCKVKRRLEDPNWKRKHEHIKTKGDI